jgi:hypothetical protein
MSHLLSSSLSPALPILTTPHCTLHTHPHPLCTHLHPTYYHPHPTPPHPLPSPPHSTHHRPLPTPPIIAPSPPHPSPSPPHPTHHLPLPTPPITVPSPPFFFLNPFVCTCGYRTLCSTYTFNNPSTTAFHVCEFTSEKSTPSACKGRHYVVPSVK